MHSLEAKSLVAGIDTKTKLTCSLPLSLLHFKTEGDATQQVATLVTLAQKLPQTQMSDAAESEAVPHFAGDQQLAISSDTTAITDQSPSLHQYDPSSYDTVQEAYEGKGVRTPSGAGGAIHPASQISEVVGLGRKPQSEMARVIERALVEDGRFDWPQGGS